MSAAVQCDGCKHFETTEPWDFFLRQRPTTVPIPDSWLRVGVAPADAQVSGYEWRVCSLACAVVVMARAAERGELP